MCLPVQKELVMVQLGTVDLLAMIFAEHSAAVRKGSSTQLQKSCIEKVSTAGHVIGYTLMHSECGVNVILLPY